MSSWPAKDPDAVLDYGYDIPLDAGDSVASYVLEKLEGDVVIDSAAINGARVTAWLSGGTLGTTSLFRISWITTVGREDDDEIVLELRDDRGLAALSGYVNATASDLKARFPRFAAVDNGVVETALTNARRLVTNAWTVDDFAMGQMLLAAHYMMLDGLGTGSEAEINSAGLGDFTSVRSGAFSFTRKGGDNSAKPGSTASTSYGARWLALARVNRGGPRTSPSGVVPDYSLYPGRYISSGG